MKRKDQRNVIAVLPPKWGYKTIKYVSWVNHSSSVGRKEEKKAVGRRSKEIK